VPYKDPEVRRQRQREYARKRYHEDDGTLKAKVSARRRNNRERYNSYARKYKYGLTHGEFEAMLAGQGGACAICHAGLAVKNVDHDHVTGMVRGILCVKCNLALGMADDSPDRLRAMAAYIDRMKETSDGK
jgi:hypothetical protein